MTIERRPAPGAEADAEARGEATAGAGVFEGAHLTYPDPQLARRHRAARALRALSEALVGHSVPDAALDEVADWAAGRAAELRQGPVVPRGEDYQRRRYLDPTPPEGVAIVSFSDRPISGPANPSAVDLVIRREGRESVGVATFDRRFESSPGRVHGGITASVFDDVMGYVNVIEGVAAYTYELSVRYLAGMPLGEPVVVRARMDNCDWDRRRSTVTAEATLADGTVAADARASFALVPRERFGL